MATRQAMHISKVVKQHVNSDDGSATYEAATAYPSGTMVIYDGKSYCSIVDISADDTDTPAEAIDKWAIVLN